MVTEGGDEMVESDILRGGTEKVVDEVGDVIVFLSSIIVQKHGLSLLNCREIQRCTYVPQPLGETCDDVSGVENVLEELAAHSC